MLDQSISFLGQFLDQELKTYFQVDSECAVVGPLMDLDGSTTRDIENKIVISIIHLEQGPSLRNRPSTFSTVQEKQPVLLDYYVLITANYISQQYLEGLKMLSETMAIFNETVIFNHETHPALPNSLERIYIEPIQIPLNNLNDIWDRMGVNYLPSCIYKIRIAATS